MCSAAPSTTNPLQTYLKHAWLSPYPTKIIPQQVANSLDEIKAHFGVLQHMKIAYTPLVQLHNISIWFL